MVDPVNKVSRGAGVINTQVDNTLSIGADSNNAWMAARQDEINRGLLELQEMAMRELQRRKDENEPDPEPDDDSPSLGGLLGEENPPKAEPKSRALSGESDRIGSVNFDDETPFGHRTAIL